MRSEIKRFYFLKTKKKKNSHLALKSVSGKCSLTTWPLPIQCLVSSCQTLRSQNLDRTCQWINFCCLRMDNEKSEDCFSFFQTIGKIITRYSAACLFTGGRCDTKYRKENAEHQMQCSLAVSFTHVCLQFTMQLLLVGKDNIILCFMVSSKKI